MKTLRRDRARQTLLLVAACAILSTATAVLAIQIARRAFVWTTPVDSGPDSPVATVASGALDNMDATEREALARKWFEASEKRPRQEIGESDAARQVAHIRLMMTYIDTQVREYENIEAAEDKRTFLDRQLAQNLPSCVLFMLSTVSGPRRSSGSWGSGGLAGLRIGRGTGCCPQFRS